ncbi:hypothetical protein N1614_04235 [Adlercreutzia muris]|uniref:hypothetical protein n=1 Tax=Adlercreutzia muris TaxID=1796610 RepID=UPI0021D59464|nr:hypothetical protein [Adlercreutzia muris]MCU7584556.1 hypothetical protein [Adlercreutzia muris]
MRNADGIEATLYDGAPMTPERRVEHALAWIAGDYPRKWLRLVNLCERAMADGWPRIRRGDLYVMASQQGLDITLCREFRMDNNLWSVLSRYLLMFRPSLADVIFPRRTPELDEGIDFEALWHRDVAANTFFRAPTWEAAAKRGRAA